MCGNDTEFNRSWCDRLGNSVKWKHKANELDHFHSAQFFCSLSVSFWLRTFTLWLVFLWSVTYFLEPLLDQVLLEQYVSARSWDSSRELLICAKTSIRTKNLYFGSKLFQNNRQPNRNIISYKDFSPFLYTQWLTKLWLKCMTRYNHSQVTDLKAARPRY